METSVDDCRGARPGHPEPPRSGGEGSCAPRWTDATLRERRTRSLPAALRRLGITGAGLLFLAATVASAQVGHAPQSSPYRDIFKGHSVTGFGGYIGGSGGEFGIGPHEGTVYGFRYDIRTGSAVQFGLMLAQANLERLIVDPFIEVENRVSGPVDQQVGFAEVDLQLNLTGGKTWRRLAPFVGAGVGLTFAEGTDADTSGYEFGNKIYFAPHAGIRAFLSPRLHLRGDARIAFWKMQYPESFAREPPLDPGTPDEPNAVSPDGSLSEWTTASWLQVGLGYSFSF